MKKHFKIYALSCLAASLLLGQTASSALPVLAEEMQDFETAENSPMTNDFEKIEKETREILAVDADKLPAAKIKVRIGSDEKEVDSIEDAVKAITSEGTITIPANTHVSGQARIRAGQTIDIHIGFNVIWDNSSDAVPAGSWNNSVIVNEGGTLTVNSLGSVVADTSKPQSFAVYNHPSATTILENGRYTSRHGDYIIMNQGTMELNKVLVSKPNAGSHTAVLNGFRYDNPGSNPEAMLTVSNSTVYAPEGIALKNDTYGSMTVKSGVFSAKTCPIQNIHKLTVTGGTFHTMHEKGYGIYNSPSNTVFAEGQIPAAVGNIEIRGGDFFAESASATILHTNTANGTPTSSDGKKPVRISGGSYWADQENLKTNILDGYILKDYRLPILPYNRWRVVPEETSSGSKPGGSSGGSSSIQKPAAQVDLHRVYNPNSGEHFYTSNLAERDSLIEKGWKDEGIGWTSPAKSNHPVYRLYNPNAGDHHYTLDVNEKKELIAAGWNDEGISWYSDTADQGTAVYRTYNPNAKEAGAHHYTLNKTEKDHLVSLGWKDEGTAWHAAN